MKQQSKDTIWYDERLFLLDADSSLKLPLFDKLGIQPRYKSSDCLRGYLAIYEFIDSQLYLIKIAVGHSRDFDKYAKINGISPRLSGYNNCDVIYDLKFPMSIDTTITLGVYSERLGDILLMQVPAHEVLKLKLVAGKLEEWRDVTKEFNELHTKIRNRIDDSSLSHLLKEYSDLLQREIP